MSEVPLHSSAANGLTANDFTCVLRKFPIFDIYVPDLYPEHFKREQPTAATIRKLYHNHF